ncbi:MAG: transcriptional repressor [Anaerolineae bacterium]|jgi:Fur family ferric uptake transcriptional regulator|nr:transcriptional repressor [Anaerolineae bacterium]
MSAGPAAALERALRARGYRLTAARQAILAALAAAGEHPTADALAAAVHQAAPGVGRMTVYRTLDLLCDLGLLRPVYQGTGAAHYVLLLDGHHHHLVCSRCRRVIEFDDCALGELAETVARRYGFVVEGHLLEFYGRCAECRG